MEQQLLFMITFKLLYEKQDFIHCVFKTLNTTGYDLTSRKQVRVMKPPYTPILYSKTGVYRGMHFFLFFLLNIDCGYSMRRF